MVRVTLPRFAAFFVHFDKLIRRPPGPLCLWLVHCHDDDDAIDQAGTEFQISTLLGSNAEIYFMLINQYYKKSLKDDEMKKIIAFHIECGLKNEDFKDVFI